MSVFIKIFFFNYFIRFLLGRSRFWQNSRLLWPFFLLNYFVEFNWLSIFVFNVNKQNLTWLFRTLHLRLWFLITTNVTTFIWRSVRNCRSNFSINIVFLFLTLLIRRVIRITRVIRIWIVAVRLWITFRIIRFLLNVLISYFLS